jgi:subtilisin family serine protease
MLSSVQQQIAAYGAAQVMVVLKAVLPPIAPAAKPSAALAAAVPVAAARTVAGGAEPVVTELAKHFRVVEQSTDTALATWFKHRKRKTPGVTWYEHAKSSTDSTPPVRYFPHLRIMLGTVDEQGAAALDSHPRVKQVAAPPILSLIRPVAARTTRAPKQYTWGITRLKADQLHAAGFTGKGILVGHLDTGADGTHSALKNAFHAFAEFDDLGFEVKPTPQPHDTDEHGTHTAGTIAGRTVAGRAIGVAPEALLASAIVIEGGNVNARILAGMEWVISEGAKILSMSLGVRGYQEDFLAVTQRLRELGVLPVFAVGNEGPGTSRSPGNYVEALSVGAMGEDEHVADFSSSRRFDRPDNPLVPDLVAPGVDVISAKPGGGYQAMDGSSMATPHIAGLAALLMQAAPAATIDQIEQAIFDSCTLLPGEDGERQNRGVPDAVVALAKLGVTFPAVATAAAAVAQPPRRKKTASARRKKKAAATSARSRKKPSRSRAKRVLGAAGG